MALGILGHFIVCMLGFWQLLRQLLSPVVCCMRVARPTGLVIIFLGCASEAGRAVFDYGGAD